MLATIAIFFAFVATVQRDAAVAFAQNAAGAFCPDASSNDLYAYTAVPAAVACHTQRCSCLGTGAVFNASASCTFTANTATTNCSVIASCTTQFVSCMNDVTNNTALRLSLLSVATGESYNASAAFGACRSFACRVFNDTTAKAGASACPAQANGNPAYDAACVAPRAVTTTTSSAPVTTTAVPCIKADPGATDVYFLADTTGSMAIAHANFRARIDKLAENIQFSVSDVRMGLGEFKDTVDDFVFRNNLVIANNSMSTILSAAQQWSAKGGGDLPEGQIYAYHQIATRTDLGWRAAAATKILIVFGDANGHDPSNGVSLADAIAALKAKGIRVMIVDIFGGMEKNGGQATNVTRATGGVYVNAQYDNIMSSINGAILSILSSATWPATNGVPPGGRTVCPLPNTIAGGGFSAAGGRPWSILALAVAVAAMVAVGVVFP